MKKIMFNDRYGLTQAVLEGRKTMTRRICKPQPEIITIEGHGYYSVHKKTHFHIGEVVAVAQNYGEIGLAAHIYEPGWDNKMFVKADLMPHQIRITNVRVERLQDISDEDCLREGIIEQAIGVYRQWYVDGLQRPRHNDGVLASFLSPRAAFAALIDKVSGKGTWGSNLYVFVYEFELVK